jgi:putative salt-induced outer membrane protein YdiY
LNSGEWLKGDLKVMYDQRLEFDSDKMDIQDFDFDDVIIVRTRNAQRVLIQKKGRKAEIHTGLVELDNKKITLLGNGESVEFPRDEIVSIAQRAERERDRWSGSLSVGVNVRGGNSETADATLSANLKRQTALTRYNVDYLSNYSTASREETAENHRLNMDASLFLSDRLYWRILEAEFYRDRFSNIDRQFSAHTGLGYYLVRTPKMEWSTGAGVGYQRTEYISVEAGEDNAAESPFFSAGTVLDYELNSNVDYLLDYSFRLLNESNGSYTHHLVTTLSMDLIGDNVDGDISLIWDRIENPTANENGEVPKQDDYQLIFSLTYDF